MYKKIYSNNELKISLTVFTDDKQNIWFKGKDIAEILGYNDTNQAIRLHIEYEDRLEGFPVEITGKCQSKGRPGIFINESGFYSLIFSSKLETAKKFKHWVTSKVIPSIRKYGQFKLFDNLDNKMILIGNEKELHYKVVNMILQFYPNALLIAGLGENQDTDNKRLDSYRKGYQRGQSDLIILNNHKEYSGLCFEFKSPTNNFVISNSQKEMQRRYIQNGYQFIISNNYDEIIKTIHDYMVDIRILRKYCDRKFKDKHTLEKHNKYFHKI